MAPPPGTTSASAVGRAVVGSMVETSRRAGVDVGGGGGVGTLGVMMAGLRIGGCLTLDGEGGEEGGEYRLGRLGGGTRHRTGGDRFCSSIRFCSSFSWRRYYFFFFFSAFFSALYSVLYFMLMLNHSIVFFCFLII
jgi:hypothetical protein